MKIGLIVAIEMDSIFAHYENPEKLDCPKGFELYHTKRENSDIYILHTGMGVIAAAAGVQYLATAYKVDIIANFGVVGGLTGEMSRHRICIIDRVVHYKYDCSEFMDLAVGQVAGHDSIYLPTDLALVDKAVDIIPDLMRAACCSGDKFVGTAEEKMRLHDDFGGDVCDMESAGIVLACELNGLPCVLFKAVSDGLTGGSGEFYTELQSAASECLETADRIISAL